METVSKSLFQAYDTLYIGQQCYLHIQIGRVRLIKVIEEEGCNVSIGTIFDLQGSNQPAFTKYLLRCLEDMWILESMENPTEHFDIVAPFKEEIDYDSNSIGLELEDNQLLALVLSSHSGSHKISFEFTRMKEILLPFVLSFQFALKHSLNIRNAQYDKLLKHICDYIQDQNNPKNLVKMWTKGETETYFE